MDTLVAHPDQWYRIAGSDPCRQPDDHEPPCRCAVRVLIQTAYRIRRRTLGAFAYITYGCFQAVALSAPDRPDLQWPIEIKARWVEDCP